jgi:sarcosine oxidase subunit alpha
MGREEIKFNFGNQEVEGYVGDTIATALLRNGIHVFDRSVKRRRKRGASCLEGYCMSCLVEVDGEADILACRTKIKSGMEVKYQVAWPSPRLDFRAPIQQIGFALFGQELYYQLFTRPVWLNEIWIHFLAKMSGRGRLADSTTSHAPLPMKSLSTQVLVIGAGVAGLSAAHEMSRAGLEVMLIDRGEEPGGWWNKWNAVAEPPGAMKPLKGALPRLSAEIHLIMNTTLLGLYEGNLALAIGEDQAYRIHYERAVIAAGCYPKVIRYPGSDEPTHLPAQGLIRSTAETGWFPPSVVLLDLDGLGSSWAEALRSLGSDVKQYSMEGEGKLPGGIQAFNGGKWSGVKLKTGETYRGAVVCWSAGWYPKHELIRQAGGQVVYSESREMFVPLVNDKMEVSKNVFVAGGCAGKTGFSESHEQGSEVGKLVVEGF